jgi:hypothetical protein
MPSADELVHGIENTATYLGRTPKGAYGALESGRVPGGKKIAGKWALHLPTFYASFKA